MAVKLQSDFPHKFKYFPISWSKFPDGTDDITIEGFTPENFISRSHVLFIASFHSNDVTLSQFSVLIVLLQSFISSLTILLPFFPVGTNERVEVEGKVATANTYSTLLSNLPSCGVPTRLMIYDIHALQNRFYFHGNIIPSLQTTIPILFNRLKSTSIRCVCFPDDGAAKRFGTLFRAEGFEIIICGKVRDGERRIVRIQDGHPEGKDVVVVDDLVQTGSTLYECALALRREGALQVNVFVAHGVFPSSAWSEFCRNRPGGPGSRSVFDHFWITNSVPTVVNQLPSDDVFEVLDLMPQIMVDLNK